MTKRLAFAFVPLSLVMCASALTVRVEQAPEYAPSRRISVLGVFHDGLLNDAAWRALSPKISAALGQEDCELGYGQKLREANPELAASIEHDVRENGVDDALLARVSPGASGDLVMVLMSYKQIPASRDGGARRSAQASAPMQMGGRGRGGMGGARSGFGSGATPPPEDEHLFELSASLFSVSLHKLVAQIDLRYTGEDLDEAMDAFTKKLRALAPGAACVGWTWEAPQDTTDAGPE